MSLVIEAGLRCGSYNGFHYVYGVPFQQSMDEVVSAFKEEFTEGQIVKVFRDRNIGNVYVVTDKDDERTVSNDVFKHIQEEFYDCCFEWYEFDNARAFVDYYSRGIKDSNTKLFMDTDKNVYYARRNRPNACALMDFANCLDISTTYDMERRKNLTEVSI